MTLPQASPEDVQEQSEDVLAAPPAMEEDLPEDVDEADAAEQRREIPLDEEDAPIG